MPVEKSEKSAFRVYFRNCEEGQHDSHDYHAASTQASCVHIGKTLGCLTRGSPFSPLLVSAALCNPSDTPPDAEALCGIHRDWLGSASGYAWQMKIHKAARLRPRVESSGLEIQLGTFIHSFSSSALLEKKPLLLRPSLYIVTDFGRPIQWQKCQNWALFWHGSLTIRYIKKRCYNISQMSHI